MASRAARPHSKYINANLSPAERWVSILGGLGLAAAAVRRGSLARRAGFGLVGATLLARGAIRFCAVKAAVTGQTPLGRGLAEQVRRGAGMFRAPASGIANLEDLYTAELQELYSAETQLVALLPDIADAVSDARLRQRLADYAVEIQTRLSALESHIKQRARDPRAHPDQAMQALASEARKMLSVAGGSNVRDAGLIASLQRILHYRIAAYGTVAAYARTLGETYHAGRLGGCADRDKEVDAQLTDLAERIVNLSPMTETAGLWPAKPAPGTEAIH